MRIIAALAVLLLAGCQTTNASPVNQSLPVVNDADYEMLYGISRGKCSDMRSNGLLADDMQMTNYVLSFASGYNTSSLATCSAEKVGARVIGLIKPARGVDTPKAAVGHFRAWCDANPEKVAISYWQDVLVNPDQARAAGFEYEIKRCK